MREPLALARCPNRAEHTESPEGYLAWHEWAEKKAKTHRQIRCPGCKRWAIWVPLGQSSGQSANKPASAATNQEPKT